MKNPFAKKPAPPPAPAYEPEKYVPVIRSSICTGEKTAGFKEKATGKFVDIALIRTDRDLKDFRDRYGITGEIRTEY